MTFLPIVSRELRVASRRTSTFYGRSIVAAIATVIGGFFLFMGEIMNRVGVNGGFLFKGVSWYVWLIAMLAGVLLASDSISEERREGTLGFLFLTDLKGYDVVLGKFAGVSLSAFYGMLAVFPVLGISMLAGGVTAGEFWRVCLVLVNTLFFSVAASMWISANCKSSSRGITLAIGLLIGFIAIGVLASILSSAFPKFAVPFSYLGSLSPVSSFILASAANYLYRSTEFWSALEMSNAVGWVFLGLASWRLSFFTEKAKEKAVWQRTLTRIVLGPRTTRAADLLSINPVAWMVGYSARLRWIIWVLAILGSAAFLLIALIPQGVGFMMGSYIGWPFFFILKVFFAIQSCLFFSDSRRSGALELLCCTPLTIRSMISGQWMALRRTFLWPVLVLILSQVVSLCLAERAFILNMPNSSGGEMISLMFALQVGKSVTDFFAIGWLGMWLALTLRKPGSATGLTILFVMVLPPVLFCIPTVLIDAVLIAVSYSKLQQDFRSPAIASRVILAHPSAA